MVGVCVSRASERVQFAAARRVNSATTYFSGGAQVNFAAKRVCFSEWVSAKLLISHPAPRATRCDTAATEQVAKKSRGKVAREPRPLGPPFKNQNTVRPTRITRSTQLALGSKSRKMPFVLKWTFFWLARRYWEVLSLTRRKGRQAKSVFCSSRRTLRWRIFVALSLDGYDVSLKFSGASYSHHVQLRHLLHRTRHIILWHLFVPLISASVKAMLNINYSIAEIHYHFIEKL